MPTPLIAPDKVITPVDPIELELASAIVPLCVAGVALLLYKAPTVAPPIPGPFRVKLLALA